MVILFLFIMTIVTGVQRRAQARAILPNVQAISGESSDIQCWGIK